MTPAMRLAKKELRSLGCKIVKKSPHHLVFKLLNGAQYTVNTSTPIPRVREVIGGQTRFAATLTDDAIARSVVTNSAPVLTAGDFVASEHFTQRLELMRGQGMRYPEVRDAILTPDETRVGDNGRWIYIRGRVAVVVADMVNGAYPLITILWTTRELYAMNPRPGR